MIALLVGAALAAPDPAFFDAWQPLDAFEAELAALDAAHDDVALVTLGESVEGRPLYALRIGSPAAQEGPGVLVTAVQHAREWVAGSSALWIARHLAEDSDDPEVAALRDRYWFLVVPIANPDGYRYTWTTDRVWRKNRRDNGDGTFGVDLNRNWNVHFGEPGASDDPAASDYHGPSPFSEPEARALRAAVLANPGLALHLDLHSTSQAAMSPWGWTGDPAPDADVMLPLVADAAAAMSAVDGRTFRSGSMYDALYVASGVGVDWTYGNRGLWSFLFELRDRGEFGFLLPEEQILPAAAEAWAGLYTLASADLGPTSIRPTETALDTGTPPADPDVPAAATPSGGCDHADAPVALAAIVAAACATRRRDQAPLRYTPNTEREG